MKYETVRDIIATMRRTARAASLHPDAALIGEFADRLDRSFNMFIAERDSLKLRYDGLREEMENEKLRHEAALSRTNAL